MLVKCSTIDCGNSSEFYTVWPVAQNLFDDEVICNLSGDFNRFSGDCSNCCYVVDDIPFYSGDFYGTNFKQVCIPPKYGVYLSYSSILAGKWQEIRDYRDSLLSNSDYTQIEDYDLGYSGAIQEEWAIYRQTLRDIPQDFDDPFHVVFPESPEE